MTFLVTYAYDFSTTTTAPPSSSQVRLDAPFPYTAVTKIWFRLIDADGVDVYRSLMAMPVGATLYVQDKNDHLVFVQVQTLGSALDNTTHIEIPVAWVANGTALANQPARCAVFLPTAAPTPTPTPPAPMPAGPDDFFHVTTVPLVTLDVAKFQLRITDTLHDADIQLKMAQATDTVLDYLKHAADPTWTPDTVPRPVQSAILIYLTHLYEHRGDDMSPTASGQTPDADVWLALERLLKRFRDLALA